MEGPPLVQFLLVASPQGGEATPSLGRSLVFQPQHVGGIAATRRVVIPGDLPCVNPRPYAPGSLHRMTLMPPALWRWSSRDRLAAAQQGLVGPPQAGLRLRMMR